MKCSGEFHSFGYCVELAPMSLVLDPFAGSGTTAAAAKSLGLRCVTIESEERYCEQIAKRLAQGVLL